MSTLAWSERKLPFGRPVEELPLLLERMRGMPVRVAELFRAAGPHRLLLRREGSWCALEHAAHLLLLDQRLQARIDDFSARRMALSRIDLADQHQVLAGARGRHPGDLLEELRLTRLDLVRRFAALEGPARSHRATHPCMGAAYAPADMALWIAEHDDHHLLAMRGALSGPARDC